MASPAALLASLAGENALVSLTGGGGKTSLMFALADEVSRRAPVLTTTTTHIETPPPGRTDKLIIGEDRWDDWREALAAARRVTAAAAQLENGKLRGFPSATVDEMHRLGMAGCVIVEADGAKRKPFKAYEPHEPVVPARATLCVTVVGAEPFFEPLTDENTFRLDRLAARRGIRPGTLVSAEEIADILSSPDEYARGMRPAALRVVMINKCDMADEPGLRRVEAALQRRLRSYDMLVMASLRENIVYGCAELARDGDLR